MVRPKADPRERVPKATEGLLFLGKDVPEPGGSSFWGHIERPLLSWEKGSLQLQ